MARMRLISEAYKLIKKEDPDTSITLNHLRVLVKDEKIPSIKSGRKTLINYDSLIEYLNSK